MPQEKKTEAPKVDVFGSSLEKEDVKPVEMPGKKSDEGKKPEFDVATHPTVVEMNKKIEEQSKNLSEQGRIIREQKKRFKELEESKGEKDEENEEVNLPHPEIKRSKDLTEAERDEMTANEIKMLDEKADLQEAANKAAIEAHKAKKKEKKAEKSDEGDDEEESPKKLLEAEIETLSGGDAERKRELIEAAKLTNFSGLKTKEEIAERMKMAVKLIPNWTPPKEQQTASGGAVKTGGGTADEVNVDKIIQEARQGSTGVYSL